jgi:glutaredoxin
MASVVIYGKAGCHLCDVAKAAIVELQQSLQFELTYVDIAGDPMLAADYGTLIPLVFVGNTEVARYRVDPAVLRTAILEAG